MLDTIYSHRSIRKYRKDPVSKFVLETILDAGTRASTTGNMQWYSMIVTTDPELKKKLWEAHFKQNMVLEAPVHITFCADLNRFNKWCNQRNASPAYDNFLSFFTAAIDALLVCQNVCLAAESYRLGICYLGTVTYMAESIIDILKIPEGVVPVASIVLGYPHETPHLTDRLPLEAVTHYETYKDYSKEDIDKYYSKKESLALYKHFVIENELETLAQVFTEKRYPKKDNVHFSKEFLKIIKRQGFMHNE
jgi:nitroreductase